MSLFRGGVDNLKGQDKLDFLNVSSRCVRMDFESFDEYVKELDNLPEIFAKWIRPCRESIYNHNTGEPVERFIGFVFREDGDYSEFSDDKYIFKLGGNQLKRLSFDPYIRVKCFSDFEFCGEDGLSSPELIREFNLLPIEVRQADKRIIDYEPIDENQLNMFGRVYRPDEPAFKVEADGSESSESSEFSGDEVYETD